MHGRKYTPLAWHVDFLHAFSTLSLLVCLIPLEADIQLGLYIFEDVAGGGSVTVA